MNLSKHLIDFLRMQPAGFSAQLSRGIEKEALRIKPNGQLADSPHPKNLGSALTHSYITTDYSESLLEFITPVEQNTKKSIEQLLDLHKFSYQQHPNELLWPMSMPCFVGKEDDIQLAYYGESNIGKMKTLYREGLKYRYGSYMQVISGVHFNFSFPISFWQAWAKDKGQDCCKDMISCGYLSVLRNVKRHLWVLAYLFGASPALCSSFLKDKKSNFPFEKIGKGTLYLPYATSLRMSDLGYTNKAQSSLGIRYNQLDEYIAGIKKAIKMPSADFAHIPYGKNGDYKQLNNNVLQIENEYYSPVRPKRVTLSGEKPSEALERDGIQYIEIRALDIDPFSPAGVSEDQVKFLDLFLTWCALVESPELHASDEFLNTANMQQTLLYGRKPNVKLKRDDQDISLTDWALDIFAELKIIAEIFDQDSTNKAYQLALEKQLAKINNSDLTPSAKIINQLLEQNIDNGALGMQLAKQYQAEANTRGFYQFDPEYLNQETQKSFDKQVSIEASDKLDFTDFLQAYFAD